MIPTIPQKPLHVWVWRAYVTAFFVYLALPLTVVCVFAFNDSLFPSLPWQGFTLDWFWGFDSRGVWVDRGCRATFRIDYIGAGNSWYPGQGQNYMRCESRDYRQAQCRVGYNVRSVRLVRQVSDSACIEGRSWGFNRGVIWVDNGCAADFELR